MLELESSCRLSHYLSLRPTGEGFLVESLLTGSFRIFPSQSPLRLLLSFSQPRLVGEVLAAFEDTQRSTLLAFLRRCQEDGFLTYMDEDGHAEQDRDSLTHWEFHDLQFHVRSRRGRNLWPVGATFHLSDRLPTEPAFRPETATREIPLARPDPTADDQTPSLFEVLEKRRTRYSLEPVTLSALGLLLFRACRVTAVGEPMGEVTLKKPYPSPGSLHPLEIYVAAWRCAGLEQGLYHYRARTHTLALVRESSPEIEKLLGEAQRDTGGNLPGYPSLLLIVSVRFRRVARKYQSIAYRLILQEVGVLYQTMYLVATALGLSACAIGTGNSDLFSQVLGVDYYQETSVGEFILGGGSP